MSQVIKLKKGFDINLAGKAEKVVIDTIQSDTYAIKPTDFTGFVKPKVLVEKGDTVKAGSPLYYDKSFENVMFTSPVSGEVVEVKRGEKRRLEEIIILADKSTEYEDFGKSTISEIPSLQREDIVDKICKSGIWPRIIQRPYAVVANPADTPKAIFISGFDTSPLAPDYNLVFKNEEENFKAGIEVLKKLTSGSVYLNLSADKEVSKVFTSVKGIKINKFSGPHPSGNVGVQIHHLDPIHKEKLAWTISPYGVVEIGRLFLAGKYDASKIIALAGSEVKEPKYYKTLTGVNIKNFVENNLKSDHVRYISGNVLTGEKIRKDGYLGYYDNMFTVIPEGDDNIFFGSFEFTKSRLSYQKAFGLLSFINNLTNPKKEYVVDTNINGEHRAFVQTGVLEQVLPMDIYPQYLCKAILAEDFDEMEALGIYEIAEEDVALCEFVDVSKHEIQSIIRDGIELMRNS